MPSNTTMIRKLQQALNLRGCKILYTTSQFYSVKQQRPVTFYHIKQAVVDENNEKPTNIELFKSTSQIQVVLFLRDKWYDINGWEIPKDNEKWEQIKGGTE